MNNSRRKRISQCISELYDAHSHLIHILDKEQDALANVPDDEEYDDKREGMNEVIDATGTGEWHHDVRCLKSDVIKQENPSCSV